MKNNNELENDTDPIGGRVSCMTTLFIIFVPTSLLVYVVLYILGVIK
jgi:hypothetical protein